MNAVNVLVVTRFVPHDLARETNARMIVVGSRGEGTLKRVLVGSIPHKLLQVADRPLLVVPE